MGVDRRAKLIVRPKDQEVQPHLLKSSYIYVAQYH